MTEVEWLACEDPEQMLEALKGKVVDKEVGDRKLRLFICACCRKSWRLLDDESNRKNVELAERFVDGQAIEEEMAARRAEIYCLGRWPPGDIGTPPIMDSYWCVHGHAYWGAKSSTVVVDESGRTDEVAASALLRDMIGPLLFRSLTLVPTWKDCTVSRLARAIYDERSFDRLPILADALEDAGCTHQDILEHCRGSAEHVRGCWVVDRLLGRS